MSPVARPCPPRDRDAPSHPFLGPRSHGRPDTWEPDPRITLERCSAEHLSAERCFESLSVTSSFEGLFFEDRSSPRSISRADRARTELKLTGIDMKYEDRRKLREEYTELIVLCEENRDSTQWGSEKVSPVPRTVPAASSPAERKGGDERGGPNLATDRTGGGRAAAFRHQRGARPAGLAPPRALFSLTLPSPFLPTPLRS